MAGVDHDNPNWKERFVAEMKADKKRAAVLGCVAVVALIVGGRLIVKNLPISKAGAALSDVQPSAVVVESDPMASFRDQFAAPSAKGGREVSPAVPTARREITRDIFAPKLDFYPPDQEAPAVTKVSPVAPAIDANVLQAQSVRAQARSLVLQSTIISSRPTAIVNGQVLGVGDWINGFEVVEITARACAVAKKGIRVQLEMSE